MRFGGLFPVAGDHTGSDWFHCTGNGSNVEEENARNFVVTFPAELVFFRERYTMAKSVRTYISHTDMTATIAPPFPFLATDGQDVDLLPIAVECTVAQAAQFLDRSEGSVHEYLDDNLISFRLENGERLIQWNSLQEFAQELQHGRDFIAEMVRLDQEMGLYD
jgi:hypothetical protein